MSRLSEDDLIATLFAPMAGPGGLGLRDDAALVAHGADEELVVTVDAVVADVHFFADDPPDAIAAKALGVNLSDLAAKAAAPAGFLLTLALPPTWTRAWLEAFAAGLRAEASRADCPLLGGDTVSTPGPLMISITAFGTVPRGHMLPRTGARPGDALYVSGTIGDSALGLHRRCHTLAGLDAAAEAYLDDRYLRPQARLGLRAALRACAHAGMDVSDGLVGDLTKMLRASGVTGTIWLPQVPLSGPARAALKQDGTLFPTLVIGGDDYEVIAAVDPAKTDAFIGLAAEAGLAVTRIGEVRAGDAPPLFIGHEGEAMSFERGSFSHF